MAIHVYNGSSWQEASGTISRYNGSTWQAVTRIWRYNGSSWVEIWPQIPTVEVPTSPFTISNCFISCDFNCWSAESVEWQYRVDGGSWTPATPNTANTSNPPSNPYTVQVISGPEGAYEFRFTPYTEDSGGGTAGDTVQSAISNDVTCT